MPKIDSEDLLSPVLSRYTPVIAEYGKGMYIYDRDGSKYLDFTSGIAVTSTGHCHPSVVQAVQDQAAKLLHGQINIVLHQPVLDLVRELKDVTPPGLSSFFFSNSGAEAVEGAVKLARQVTGRPNIIVFQGSFHGRTALTMALTTSKTIYRAGYQPLPAGVHVAPYPHAYRYGWTPAEAQDFCLRELEFLLQTQTAPSETAAMLIEPVLGEGGYVVPPRGFLRNVRQICDEHRILLIADEVQTGFGRTGSWFATQHFDTTPDIMTVAKGMASGLPLSAVVSRPEIMRSWSPGSHGGTFGGNAISCAAALATIRVIKEENLLTNAQEQGTQLIAGLRSIQAEYEGIGDVRGLGLMIGTEFVKEGGKPDKSTAKRVQKDCIDNGLLLLTCGSHENVIRWMPPLVVAEDEVDRALDIFEQAVSARST
ncbi:MAG: aspartate aminotransferase family protein [bacterium]